MNISNLRDVKIVGDYRYATVTVTVGHISYDTDVFQKSGVWLWLDGSGVTPAGTVDCLYYALKAREALELSDKKGGAK